jgi:thiamine kinase-like enzyme
MIMNSHDIKSFGEAVIEDSGMVYTPLSGGVNNQLWRVQPNNAPHFVIKNYGPDGEDRLRREWVYLSLLDQHTVPNCPKPLYQDASQNLAAYSLMPGKKLLPRQVNISHINMAAQHIISISDIPTATLDRAKGSHDGASGHIHEITDRIRRLEQALQCHPCLDRLHNFVMKRLKPLWHYRRLIAMEADLSLLFSGVKLYLSPSDFGFHNVLATESALSFIDFEYSGADDLAKLAADFSLVPQISVSDELAVSFAAQLKRNIDLDEHFEQRVSFLRFVGEVKWICIILNEFLPEKQERLSNASSKSVFLRQNESLTLAEEFFNQHEMTEFTL